MPDEWVVPPEVFEVFAYYKPHGLNYTVYTYVLKRLREADPSLDMGRTSPARSLANKLASGGSGILQEIALSCENHPQNTLEFWAGVARGLQSGARIKKHPVKPVVIVQAGNPYREVQAGNPYREMAVRQPDPKPKPRWLSRVTHWLTWVMVRAGVA